MILQPLQTAGTQDKDPPLSIAPPCLESTLIPEMTLKLKMDLTCWYQIFGFKESEAPTSWCFLL
jgi:hypothetical protein